MRRRSFVKALPFLGGATFAPMTLASAEEPNARVRRLQTELSKALAELIGAEIGPGDYVSIVYPADTVAYARTLIDREIFEATRRREVARENAVCQWLSADNALDAAMNPFDHTRWEFAKLDENEARNALLRTLREASNAA